MGELIQPVKDGVVEQTKANAATQKKVGGELGKDAFLQLLVTQMKYQDPLNPNTDTEYIAQLATFSQLEQLQNLSKTSANSQALSLVGKEVIIKTENSSGSTTYVSGRVDFVTMSGSKTQLSINGSLYSFDQLESVIDGEYIKEKEIPSIAGKLALQYDASNPKNITFEVNFGSGDNIADDVAIAINDTLIDASNVSISGNKITIKGDLFKNVENGTYKITLGFNDPSYTTIKNKITLQVINAAPKEEGSDVVTKEPEKETQNT
jgi:flagellar basal-body rod modification protein FlgD